MTRYLIRRLLSGIVALLLFMTILFFVFELVVPGDFTSSLALMYRGAQRASITRLLGLDAPVLQRYLLFMGNILRGNLGRSFGRFGPGPPVTAVLLRFLPATLLVFGVGAALAFVLGHWLGRLAAWRRSSPVTGVVTFTSIILHTSFPPWLVFLFSFLVLQRIGLRSIEYNRRIWSLVNYSPQQIITQMLIRLLVITMALLVINAIVYRNRRVRIPVPLFIGIIALAWIASWYLSDWWILALDVMKITVRPIGAFTLLSFGEIMVIMRTSMLDTLHEDYIQTARAKGLKSNVIRDKHAARNAMLPVLSRLVISLPYLLAGMSMIEQVLDWQGIGRLLFQAIIVQNTPIILGAIVSIGVLSLLSRLILDILVAALDPRLRSSDDERAFSHSIISGGVKPTPFAFIRYLTSINWQPSVRLRNIRRRFAESWQVFSRNRLAMFGVVLVVIFALMAASYPLLRATVWYNGIYNPEAGYDFDVPSHPSLPGPRHLLGTDTLGRDALSMLFASTRPTFVLAFVAAVTTAVISTMSGAISAVYRGWIDQILVHISDVALLAPPPMVLIIVGITFDIKPVGFGLLYGLLSGISGAAIMMRVQALTLVNRPFIDASRVSGAGPLYIISRHLIPHMLPLAAVYMMTSVAGAVFADGFTSFFGLSRIRLNWGGMIYNGLTYRFIDSTINWNVLLPAAMAMSLFAAAFYFIGRGLHEVAEPRLRGL